MTSDPDPATPAPCGCEDVCSLPPDAQRERAAAIRLEILPLVTRREPLADGLALEFADGPAVRKTLEELVAFERECCSGLAWSLTAPSEGVLRLSVRGLPPDSDFFRVFAGGERAPHRRGLARLAGALGLGTAGSLFVCCVLPVGVAALAGAAVAAPLGALDRPLPIAAGALLLAIPAWLWLRRR